MLNDSDIEREQQRLIRHGNMCAIVDFAAEHTGDARVDIRALQNAIALHGTGHDAVDFAKRVRGADLDAMRSIVLERGNGRDAMEFLAWMPPLSSTDNTVHEMKDCVYAYQMAVRLTGVDVSSLPGDVDGYDSKQHYDDLFARGIPYTDIKPLQDIILKHGDGCIAYAFARDVPGADTVALEQVVIQRGSAWAAFNFVMDIADANVQALQNVVLRGSDDKTAYEFAYEVPDADIAALQKVILTDGDADTALVFACNIAGADIKALQQVVLERGTGWDAYEFAKGVDHGADVAKLQQVVMDRGEPKAIYMFARDIPSANIKALHEKMIEKHDSGIDDGWLTRFERDPFIRSKAEDSGGLVRHTKKSRSTMG